HRLWETEIHRGAKNGDARGLSIDRAADPAPLAAGFVGFLAVRLPVGGQEATGIRAVPHPVAAEAEAAVVIFRGLERRGGGARLRRSEIDDVTRRALADRSHRDLPSLVQCGLRRLSEQIDKLMSRLEPGPPVLHPHV